jgi:hypothetical protein
MRQLLSPDINDMLNGSFEELVKVNDHLNEDAELLEVVIVHVEEFPVLNGSIMLIVGLTELLLNVGSYLVSDHLHGALYCVDDQLIY